VCLTGFLKGNTAMPLLQSSSTGSTSKRSEIKAMKTPQPHPAEKERLEALYSLGLLDSQKDERFERFVRLAKALCDVPIAAVSLVDANRQWFLGCAGLGVSETSREISFCGHTILEKSALYIPDTKADLRFADNPLVTGDPYIRFYAGCPLYMPGFLPIGTLCIIDTRPRTLEHNAMMRLRDLANCLQREIIMHKLIQDISHLSNSPALAALGEPVYDLSDIR
jgi:GAF domain-containing protein